ncbi:PKD-like family lipoprotein [Polaribacter sp. Asnod1-A03]|uniref:PKD-like family lipoprotein n=1 Tax=Polaribacter sp. Asnod1-A03 TaxID=3160581 RepID=UPI00386A3252
MFKKIKIQLVLVLFTCALMSSCLEDVGNYEYTEINEIEFGGIEETYTVNRFYNFNITPKLVSSLGEDNEDAYTYKWQAYGADGSGGNKLTTLSLEKNLLTPANLLPGEHTIFYTVQDLNTGVEFQQSFVVTIVNTIYEGWLVLSDINGEGRLDMVPLFEGEFKVRTDILDLLDSELTLTGTPKFVYTYPYDSDFYGVYVSTTGNGTNKLEPDTFEWNKSYNISGEFVSSQPEDLEVDNILGKGSKMSYAVVDGDVYYYFGLFGWLYSAPINSIDGVLFEASTLIGKGNFWGNSILYDNTNKRFVRTNFGNTSVMPTGTRFNYTTGKDLEYMVGNDFNTTTTNTAGTQIFAILRDPANSKKYLALFNATTSAQTYYAEVLATDFDQATSYAVSPNYGYLFYAVGGKVYQYDYSLKTTKLMIDKGSEEITLIKFNDFFNSTTVYDELEHQLIVCSYDGTEGTMELYDVPPVNGQIVLQATYSGFGKIKSIDYRER